jgi:FixJ family two-component response regulator
LILDDDAFILSGLERMLGGRGYHVKTFMAPAEFLDFGCPDVPCCLILDNQLNDGMTGIEVHAEMQRRGWHIPTVFLTAHWDVKSIVAAMRNGADGFLTKPFDPDELLQAVAAALDRSRERETEILEAARARLRATQLTSREKEVVKLVVSGFLNKEIAAKLGLAIVTVKVHRGRAMRKLGAGNSAELAHIAALAGLLH